MSASWKFYFGVLFVLCQVQQVLVGQQFSFQQYTTDDGLPSACIYDIVQDEKGFLWLATEAGLCQFNGQSFEKLAFSELNNKEIINLDFEAPDRIWIMDLSNQIYIYEQDSLKVLDGSWYPRQLFLTGVYQDESDNNWILNDGSNDILKVHKDSIFNKESYTTYTHKGFNSRKTFYSILDTMYLISGKGIYEFYQDTFLVYPYDNQKIYSNPAIRMPYERDVLIPTDDGKLYFFSLDDQTMRPAFEAYQDYFEVGLNRLYQDTANNLWVSTKDGLVILHYQADGSYQASRHLEGKGIGTIMQDKEGNYWISTLTDGLFFLPFLELKTYLHPQWQKTAAVVKEPKGNIVLATDDSWMIVLNEKFEYQFERKLQKGSNKVYNMLVEDQQLVISGASKIIAVDNATWKLRSISDRGSFKQIKSKEAGQYWMGQSSAFGILEEGGGFQNFKKIRTYSVCPVGENTCYFGTIDGLFLYDKGELGQVAADKVDSDIRDIYYTSDSTLYLSTQNNGLLMLKNEDIIQHFTTKNGLLSNNCKQVLVRDSIIWLATNKGIHKINRHNNSIQVLNKANGLPDDEVNALYYAQDTILAATNKGIAYFKESLELRTPPPKLYFSKIEVERRDTNILPVYWLQSDEKDVKINFSAIQYTNIQNIDYQYKMEGLEDEWISSSVDEAQFPTLPSGDYTFWVKAKSINSDWSDAIKTEFHIAKPLWEKIGFKIFLALAFLVLTYGIVWQIIENNKRKSKIETQIKTSQLTALRAQMNPHFLFNSLNSIQEFIQLQDKRAANKYLGEFSQLMRTVLNMSEKENIPLQQEIEALRLYLSLESMRFEGAFEYQIECQPSIDLAHTLIPPMLIQPYIENAILHGLNQKKGDKILTIHFIKEADFLICTITDNGIGRVAAQAIKAKKEQHFPSKGMNLIAKRLDLINSASPNKLSVNIEDLYDADGIARGTRVQLNILATT